MSNHSDPTTTSVRRAALIAGVALAAMAIVAGFANFGVLERLVTPGDADRTTHDILGAPALFRLGIISFAVVAVLDLVVAWALWIFFAPANRRGSMIAAWCRGLYAVSLGAATLSLIGAARSLSGIDADTGATAAVRRAAMDDITRFQQLWDLGLGVFGVHLLLIGWLAFRSEYVTRWVGILVAISGAGYLLDSIGSLFSGYPIEFSSVTFVGEVVLLIWLLVRGRSVTPTQRPLPPPLAVTTTSAPVLDAPGR